MDHATQALKDIRESGKYKLVKDVPVFDTHEEYDEDGNLLRRFGREELQEVCDITNRRCEGGDPSIVGLGHTIPRDPLTKKPAPEKDQPEDVGFAMDFKVGQFGPHQKTGILADYYIENDKYDEWKTYKRRSIELWPKTKIIDWIASLRKAPQRDLGLLTYSADALTPFVPKRKYFSDAAHTRQLAMAVRGEKLFYAMEEVEDIDQNDKESTDSDGQSEDTMDPTKPPDAAAPDDDFSAKIDRYMAEKYPILQKMCQEATQRYAMEANPGAVGAPIGAKLDPTKSAMDAPGGDQGIDAVGPPNDDEDSTGDDDDGQTGPGFPGATNTSVPGSKKKKKKGNTMADDKAKDDADKKRMEADGEAIRYARLEEEVKQLREARVADQKSAKKARATQRLQALQFQGFTLDINREVARYSADEMKEDQWDAEDEHIKQYYKQDSVGHVPMGGTIATAGMPQGQPPATKGRLNQDQMKKVVNLTTSKGVSYADATAQVLSGQV